MPSFNDIPQFVQNAAYHVNVDWKYLEDTLMRYHERIARDGSVIFDGYDDDADFQRGHVWTEEQQIAFVEYALQGGMSGRQIYFNNPTWQRSYQGKTVLVDGKQRLQAVRRFMRGEIPVFGHPLSEWTDRMPSSSAYFEFWINTLQTREEVIKWYLGLNAGGTPHTAEEIARVRALLA